MFASILPALRMLVVLTALTGVVYPLVTWGLAQGPVPARRQRQPRRPEWQDGGLRADRAVVRRPEVLLEPPVRDLTAALQRRGIVGLQPRPAQSALADAVAARIKALRDADPGQHGGGAGRSRHRVGQRARSGHQSGRGRLPGRARGARRAACRSPPCRRSSLSTPTAGRSVCSATRASTFCRSISRSTTLPGSRRHSGDGGRQRVVCVAPIFAECRRPTADANRG